MKAMWAGVIEFIFPPMSRRTQLGLILLVLGLAAMVLVPNCEPIPTPAESLHAAAVHGDEDAVALALHQGAAVDTRDDIGMTPLIEAARAGRLRVCQKLLCAGADVNAATRIYGTALMQAAFYDHLDVVRLLLRAGADPNYRNECGTDALQIAIGGKDFAVADELQNAIHRGCNR